MKDKPEQSKKYISRRASGRQRARKRQRLWTISLALLALAGIAGLAIWGFGREKAPAGAATLDPGRGKGSETAPVFVEEYGDFQ